LSTSKPSEGLSYRQSGVDIDAGAELVERIRDDVATTQRPGMLGSLGGFGGLFELPTDRYRHPVLVSGTDGVGTKLKLALETDQHDGIGIDLVAMCVNDVIVTGAEPLFFLDYYATSRLNVDVAERVIRSIAAGCREAGAGLIGGETAEMPGLYQRGDYDLAGFCVGVVERDQIIDGQAIQAGDQLIGIASNGIHSNGYSLVRDVLARDPQGLERTLDGRRLKEWLLAPTRIYARAIAEVLANTPINGLCHITGGGLSDNIPRIIPAGLGARVDINSWQWSALFEWLQRTGAIDTAEMRRTFNCGVGMVAIVDAEHSDAVISQLQAAGEQAWVMGDITPAATPEVVYRDGL